MSDYTPTTEEELLNFKSNAELRKTAEFDRWLAEVKREAKEEAWEEGYNAKRVETYFYDNPYRIIISANDYDQLRKALDQ